MHCLNESLFWQTFLIDPCAKHNPALWLIILDKVSFLQTIYVLITCSPASFAEQHSIFFFFCHDVVRCLKLLCDEPFVIDNKTQFAYALGTPSGKRKQWEDLYTMAVTNAHDHFLDLLEDWIGRRETRATLGELRLILKECEFINVSFKFRNIPF